MNKLLVCLIHIFICSNLFGQSWCPPGAEWNYAAYGYHNSTTHQEVLTLQFHDTITINSRLCKIIKAVSRSVTYVHWAPDMTPSRMNDSTGYITHEDNGLITIFKNGRFDTVVNFRASVGEKWLKIGNGGCASLAVVVDTGHVIINGYYLRTVVVSDDSVPSKKWRFTERIGWLTGYPFRYECGDLNYVGRAFFCYRDDSFPVYKAPGVLECKQNILSLTERYRNGFKLFPNPNNGHFNVIITSSSSVLRIINLTGIEVLNRKLSDGAQEINVAHLPPGIYFAELIQDGVPSRTKFTKQ